MNKILCPVDFSSCSLNALEFAYQMSKTLKSRLTLLHVITNESLNHLIGESHTSEKFDALKKDSEEKLRNLVSELKKKQDGDTGVSCDYALKFGSVSNGIIEYAHNGAYQLIVMGTLGVSNVTEEFFVGSNTVNTVDMTDIPILSVPESASYQPFDKIVYATDYESDDKMALQTVISIAVPCNARIRVLHISSSDNKEKLKKYEGYSEELRSFISYEKIDFSLRIDDNVADGIDAFMKESSSDLLVTLHRKKGFFERLFSKSISREMSYFTEYPLLILK